MMLKKQIGHMTFIRHCSSKSGPTKKYSSSLLLPKTTFPQRLDGTKRIRSDQNIVNSAAFQSVYTSQKSDGPLWLLHDGPPYANGPVHMGHAVNKILKDIINRWKILQGFHCRYIPGWDCHGLPIELKALSKSKSREKDAIKIRHMSRAFALEAVENQKSEFKSWGVLGEWHKPYLTMEKNFVKAQLRLFYDLIQKKFIFRRYMPVYWSPSSKTALAESELEYNPNHQSTAIYIRFPVMSETVPGYLEKFKKNLYILSWTTTPWSLAANRAIAYNQGAEYVIVGDDYGDFYIVSKKLLKHNEELSEMFTGTNISNMFEFNSGEVFTQMKYCHPLSTEKVMSLYPGSHVTVDAGTGLVHTAPGHGQEDYLLGLEHQLDLSCPVDENGCYDSTVICSELIGLDVLGSGNEKIMELLGSNILKRTSFKHSYPYDWRTKKPVILRGSKQWFIDTKHLQSNALEVIQNQVKVEPSNMFQGFESILKSRPYWCISRQRVWGVPIPIFEDKDGEVIVNHEIIEKLCSLVENNGDMDFWWTMSPEEILEDINMANKENLTKGKDILDVWFDSGSTWNAVVPKTENGQVADMYLEGLDQFSGWFYSSLLTSMAAQGKAPYRKIFVHGFALDDKGRKMSKSLGNVVAPSDIVKGHKKGPAYGVDALRYWVGAHACQSSSIQVSDRILASSKQETDRIRSILRFVISNLNEFDGPIHFKEMKLVDQYLLHCLAKYFQNISRFYDNMQFNQVCILTQNFVANEVSGFYLSIIKDRLYCEEKISLKRQSAVTTLYWMGIILTKLLSPLMPVLAQEIAQTAPNLNLDFTEPFDKSLLEKWTNSTLSEHFQVIHECRKNLNQKHVKLSDSVIVKECPSLTILSEEDLAEIFQVANVQFAIDLEESFKFVPSQLELCPRCRLYRSDVVEKLCTRCENVLQKLLDK